METSGAKNGASFAKVTVRHEGVVGIRTITCAKEALKILEEEDNHEVETKVAGENIGHGDGNDTFWLETGIKTIYARRGPMMWTQHESSSRSTHNFKELRFNEYRVVYVLKRGFKRVNLGAEIGAEVGVFGCCNGCVWGLKWELKWVCVAPEIGILLNQGLKRMDFSSGMGAKPTKLQYITNMSSARSRPVRNEAIGTDLGSTNSHIAITEGKTVNQLSTLQKNGTPNQVRTHLDEGMDTNCKLSVRICVNCIKISRRMIGLDKPVLWLFLDLRLPFVQNSYCEVDVGSCLECKAKGPVIVNIEQTSVFSGELNQQKSSDQLKYFQDVDVLKSYKLRIQELEAELLQTKRLNSSKRSETDYLDLDGNALHQKSCLFPVLDSETTEVVDNFEDEEKEVEHCSLQEKLDDELKELDKRLEQKESTVNMLQ
ncbi:Kinesin, motor domain-containing protein [Artemisia annua]|uniref:Kinesin, motor domain-containing protein n=1 Tax=Artemisia annua TaxID=35608 RepID=A0A2U1Q197_ARTAN|nr:Kinesin, motor domain-containing protein [Artemisia annua]